MAEKPKKKPAKPAKKDEPGVLGALPSQRPARIGAQRGGGAAAPKPKAAATPKPAADPTAEPKAAPAAKPRTAATPKPKAAKPRAAAKPKAAAPRTYEPTQAAEAAAEDGTTPPPASEPRPRAVREGAPGIGPATPREVPAGHGRPSGSELVATAVQAAGELAQIGVTVGGQLLKRAVDRLPRR